jgi:hypothetical protein
MNRWIFSLGCFLFFSIAVNGQTLKVRHDHNPWGKCQGELIISQEGIEYRTEGKESHNHLWKWTDIQTFDRKSPTEFTVLSYEDQKWTFGTDRHFNFTVLPDEDPLTEQTFQLISHQLNRPVVDRVEREIEAEYQLEVKHLHTFGGCEGTLYFGSDWISYQTDHEEDARTWDRKRAVESVWSSNRYQLELHVFEEGDRGFDKTRRFRFQTKEPLDQEYYEQLRREFLFNR